MSPGSTKRNRAKGNDSSSPGLPRRTRNRAAKHLALIKAATKVFAARGYHVATTREIAAEAGCAEGLIHRYFDGKNGLLLALIQHYDFEGSEKVETRPLGSSLRAEIQQLLEGELKRYWEKRDFLRTAVSSAILDPELGRSMRNQCLNMSCERTFTRLRLCEKQRLIPPGKDLEALAQMLGATAFALGFMEQVVFGTDHKRVQLLTEKLSRFLSASVPQKRRPPNPVSSAERQAIQLNNGLVPSLLS
jgi:AcrR family transcriptional regulator